MRAVACQTFAGAFARGAAEAGFELAHSYEMVGGFGAASIAANTHLLNVDSDWGQQQRPVEEWEPVRCVQLVVANPPCSGFSQLSSKEFRGVDSKINHCMWAVQELSSRIEPPPEVVAMESVQQAFSSGRGLMMALREFLEERTGARYGLWHVLHCNLGLGGSSIRKRYFYVASQVPFGVELPPIERTPVMTDAIGDLRDLQLTPKAQPYAHEATWWSEHLRSDDGLVDGHYGHPDTRPENQRINEIVATVGWLPGEDLRTICMRYYETYRTLPGLWGNNLPRLLESNFAMGFYQPLRWRAEQTPRVVTGAALGIVYNPWENRFITHRETARIQGFPDAWRIEPLEGVGGLQAFWGKGVPVHAGRWISEWARESLDGNPGTITGRQIGEREWMIDVTNTYRNFTHER